MDADKLFQFIDSFAIYELISLGKDKLNLFPRQLVNFGKVFSFQVVEDYMDYQICQSSIRIFHNVKHKIVIYISLVPNDEHQELVILFDKIQTKLYYLLLINHNHSLYVVSMY